MGWVGACGDNAAMESFFALLQKHVLDRQRWTTRDELRRAPTPQPCAVTRSRHARRPAGELAGDVPSVAARSRLGVCGLGRLGAWLSAGAGVCAAGAGAVRAQLPGRTPMPEGEAG
jgi:hypothetical protein